MPVAAAALRNAVQASSTASRRSVTRLMGSPSSAATCIAVVRANARKSLSAGNVMAAIRHGGASGDRPD